MHGQSMKSDEIFVPMDFALPGKQDGELIPLSHCLVARIANERIAPVVGGIDRLARMLDSGVTDMVALVEEVQALIATTESLR